MEYQCMIDSDTCAFFFLAEWKSRQTAVEKFHEEIFGKATEGEQGNERKDRKQCGESLVRGGCHKEW